MYRIELSKDVQQFLDKHHELKVRFNRVVRKISLNPKDINSTVKKLKGAEE